MIKCRSIAILASGLIFFTAASASAAAQSLNIPTKKWGLSFGNSKEFTGLRFNFRDSRVRRINGINATLWQPRKDNKDAVINGVSLGVIPGGGYLNGLHVGILGVAAERSLTGISLGLLGTGAGEDITGINIGGLGAGAGGSIKGINIGGLGAGCGKNLKGFNFGGLGVGAGEDVWGITIGGIGAGAGDNMTGLNIGGVGLGAGKRLAGVNLAGFGLGAGEELSGVSLAGFAAGSVRVRGLAMAGGFVGGKDIRGVFIAGACVHVPRDGRMTGFAASPFNFIKGSQNGVSIGIVNYAWSVKGAQIGLVNIVRSNPRYLRILPIFNSSF